MGSAFKLALYLLFFFSTQARQMFTVTDAIVSTRNRMNNDIHVTVLVSVVVDVELVSFVLVAMVVVTE